SARFDQNAPDQRYFHLRACAETNFDSRGLLHSVGDGELEAAGDATGIIMVCPARSLRPSSISFAFCNSSTVTLYILAIEVSVSPPATMCVFAPAGSGEDPATTAAAGLAAEGVLSPI